MCDLEFKICRLLEFPCNVYALFLRCHGISHISSFYAYAIKVIHVDLQCISILCMSSLYCGIMYLLGG